MPPLIRFLIKWSLIGMASGWLFMVLLLLTDTGGLGGLLMRSDSKLVALLVMALSFGISFAQVTVLAAVLLRDDFGGARGGRGDRLERWKAGGSAELDRDQP
ncbi:hypothetical protein [Aestuariivirga sp.]|uniref:hypothetical protein n=1 Tax=Aestuariivirga sp. TaxID=2650926 RepID=UPI00391BC261